uniref:G patch domain containing 1 n=1 Tax=Tetraodon nigroviridis TaxID=99883 RepID=H3CA33_TETNG
NMASDGGNVADFVTYGTPLEPLEEVTDEPLKKPIPLHEQTVRDEKGRYQRFHGAFTGGFSAGYFNTVGSKEGWTPSTFVSSRQQKADKRHARPEDFMDEEDFSEHGIAPRGITTSQEFSSGHRDLVQEKARAVSAQAAPIPGDTLLEELIAPARSSIGVELLRKMGWKEGQGVGPRVKRRAGHQQSGGRKVYGCVLPPAGSEDSEEEDEEEFAPENVTFAPKDVTPMNFKPKEGVQGLGYHGLDPGLALQARGGSQHVDLFDPRSQSRGLLLGDATRVPRRGGVAGQAFGLGALEDDDDEEVYHRDSMSRYDTELGGEEPGDGLYGWTAPQQYAQGKGKSRDSLYRGRILEGFTLAHSPAQDKKVFPPPTLPRNYRPVHRPRPSVQLSALSGVSPVLAEALRTSRGHMVRDDPEPGGRHQLGAGQRGALLGEDALKGPVSVLELLRPADRERLLGMRRPSGRASAPPQAAPPGAAGAVSAELQQEALAAWRGLQTSAQTFQPFRKNPSKQARYELYLSRLQQGDKDALEQSLDPAMTEWERSQEQEEFVRASILYRPSSSSLSSRFTRARHQEDEEDGVEVPRDQEGDLDDKQTAVKMKMFGQLTREAFEWHPDKLLCRRFNVPEPYPGSGFVGLPKVKRDKFSVFNFLTVTESKDAPACWPRPQLGLRPHLSLSSEAVKKSRWDVSEQQKKEDTLNELISAARQQSSAHTPPTPSSTPEVSRGTGRAGAHLPPAWFTQVKKTGDKSRPPMDLFKAIFSDSSEEKSSSSSEAESDDEDPAA